MSPVFHVLHLELSQLAPTSYATNELCEHFSQQTSTSKDKLVKLIKYLAGTPRVAYRFPWQKMPSTVETFADTYFAGCVSTRRSTSG